MDPRRFSVELPQPLQVNSKIEIICHLAEDADEFSINLVCNHNNQNKPHNVAYHHKILFRENRSLSSAKKNGVWQEEMIHDDVPVEPGKKAHILLALLEDSIYLYFNDSYHSDFSHQLPIEDIRYVQIWSGITKVYSMKMHFEDPPEDED